MPFLTISRKISRSHSASKNNKFKKILSHSGALLYKPLPIQLRKRKLVVHVKKLFALRCIVNAFHHLRSAGKNVPASHAKIMMNIKKIFMLLKLVSKREESEIVVYLKRGATVKNLIA